MDIGQYLLNATVIKEISEAKSYFQENPLNISDISDSEGHQYVDLVQEGGGVLGVGLIGYTYALEELGVRFCSLAGTSAGSINSAFLAAVGKPHQKKSVEILEILESVDLMHFVDGGKDAEELVEAISRKAGPLQLAREALKQFDDFIIRKQKGINRGDNFLNWLKENFTKYNINSTSDLNARMNAFDLKLLYNDKPYDKPNAAKLAIIASDITTQTKAVFPKMSGLYFSEPDNVNPAYFVRASMSIPIFFEPLVINSIPKSREHVLNWQKIDMAYFFGDIPESVAFVDGGVMSNFPIDIFHAVGRAPTRPTFGVKLGFDRVSTNKNNSALDIVWNCFSAARQMRDHDVIIKNKDFINLIANIDDDGIDWLNFNISIEDKVELFVRGVKAGCAFLKQFNWPDYKELRKNIAAIPTDGNYMKVQESYAKNFIQQKD